MDHKSTRRAFFTTGGALLGAGVATGVSAAALTRTATTTAVPGPDPDRAADREAIRALQAAFAVAVERKAWRDAAALFDDYAALDLGALRAQGRGAILAALESQYDGDAAVHAAYRSDAARGVDAIRLRDAVAEASFGVDVKLHVPLKDDCTAASMARLQGLMAEVRWEAGRLDLSCVRGPAGWRLSSVRYSPDATAAAS